jgi:transposase
VKSSAQLRERAARLVLEHQDERASQWAAITLIAHEFGVSSETLRRVMRLELGFLLLRRVFRVARGT